MILTEISKYLQEHEDEIKSGKSTLSLVTEKLIEILKKQPKNNVEKIIHTELSLFENSSKSLKNSFTRFFKKFSLSIFLPKITLIDDA